MKPVKSFGKTKPRLHKSIGSKISSEVQEQVEKEQTVLRKKGRKFNQIDSVVELLALVFDLNETASFQVVQQQRYIEKTMQKFDLKDPNEQAKLKQMEQKLLQYVSQRAK